MLRTRYTKYVYIYIYIHTLYSRTNMYIYIYIYIYIYTYVSTDIIHIYVYMYICNCLFVSLFMWSLGPLITEQPGCLEVLGVEDCVFLPAQVHRSLSRVEVPFGSFLKSGAVIQIQNSRALIRRAPTKRPHMCRNSDLG